MSGGFSFTAVSGSTSAGSGSDGSTGTSASTNDARGYVFNGTGWDRLRGGIVSGSSNVTSSNGGISDWRGVMHALPMARYHVTKSVLADQAGSVFNSTQRGELAVAEQYIPSYEDNSNGVAWGQERAVADSLGAWTLYSSGATRVGTSGVSLKASAGRLRKITATSVNGTQNAWIVVVNKASAPVNGDTAVWALPITHTGSVTGTFAATAGVSIDFDGGLFFSTGIAYAISTVPEKVSLISVSDFTVFAQYA